jgi:hypothetical protein
MPRLAVGLLCLWLAAVTPETARCAAKMEWHHGAPGPRPRQAVAAPAAAFAGTTSLLLLAHKSSQSPWPCGRRSVAGGPAGAAGCPITAAFTAQRHPRGALASLYMQSNKLPGGREGIFKTVERTFSVVKVSMSFLILKLLLQFSPRVPTCDIGSILLPPCHPVCAGVHESKPAVGPRFSSSNVRSV